MSSDIRGALMKLAVDIAYWYVNRSRKPRYKDQFTPAKSGVTEFFKPTSDDKFIVKCMINGAQ